MTNIMEYYRKEIEATTPYEMDIAPPVEVYVDNETGVNYLICDRGYGGGICPRYNADGTLYVSEVE